MNLIVIGAPGSGKSTQAELLAEKLGVPHLSTGKVCRTITKKKTKEGEWMKKILETGQLVPDKEMIKLFNKLIKAPKFQKGFVLEGTPRSLWQAKNIKVNFNRAFYINVSDEENIKRLVKRGRKDDDPEVIKRRLDLYHRQTEPMLDYFRKKGILEKVDGERPIKPIHQDIMKRLER